MRTPGFLWPPLCCACHLSWQGGAPSGPGSATQWPDLRACLFICKVALGPQVDVVGKM